MRSSASAFCCSDSVSVSTVQLVSLTAWTLEAVFSHIDYLKHAVWNRWLRIGSTTRLTSMDSEPHPEPISSTRWPGWMLAFLIMCLGLISTRARNLPPSICTMPLRAPLT